MMRTFRFLPVLAAFLLLCSFHASNRINTGMEIPDLTMRDTSGQLVKLRGFEGKFVYLDFWASWCKPCMKQMSYLKELQQQFKDDDRIAWVFVSYDRDVNEWKAAIQRTGITGIHLKASSKDIAKLKDELDIYGIPFTIWADGHGHIIKYDAPQPSEGVYNKLSRSIDRCAAH